MMLKIIKISKEYYYLFIPFIFIALLAIFLPFPVQDEKMFWSVIQEYGKNYLPSIAKIKYQNSPMGPLFFVFWGFLGKITNFNYVFLRVINVFLGFLSIIFLYKTFKKFTKQPTYNILVYILNPYYFLLSLPLLYTDNLFLLFLFSAIYFKFVRNKNFLAGIFITAAIYARQFGLLFPLAFFIADYFYSNKYYKQNFKVLFCDLLPYILFLPLFILWDFHVTSEMHPGGYFTENSVSSFSFSLKSISYSLTLFGLYNFFYSFFDKELFKKAKENFQWLLLFILALIFLHFQIGPNLAENYQLFSNGYSLAQTGFEQIPISRNLKLLSTLFYNLSFILIPWLYFVLFSKIKHFIENKKYLDLFFISSITLLLCIVAFPMLINSFAKYSQPIAGYLDRYIIAINWLRYLVVPGLILFGLTNLYEIYSRRASNLVFYFSKIIFVIFLVFEAIYTYTWDKHYLPILPFILILITQHRR